MLWLLPAAIAAGAAVAVYLFIGAQRVLEAAYYAEAEARWRNWNDTPENTGEKSADLAEMPAPLPDIDHCGWVHDPDAFQTSFHDQRR